MNRSLCESILCFLWCMYGFMKPHQVKPAWSDIPSQLTSIDTKDLVRKWSDSAQLFSLYAPPTLLPVVSSYIAWWMPKRWALSWHCLANPFVIGFVTRRSGAVHEMPPGYTLNPFTTMLYTGTHSDKKNLEWTKRMPIQRVAKLSTCWKLNQVLIWLSSIVTVPLKWGVLSLLRLIIITLFIIKGNYPSKSISKLSMQSLKGISQSNPKALTAAPLWQGILLILSTFSFQSACN